MSSRAVGDPVKGLILGRIRDALGARRRSAADEYPDIRREYRRSPTLDVAAVLEMFVDRLLHYQVGVERCGPGGLPRAIAETLSARGKRAVVTAPGVPREWLPPGIGTVPDSGLTPGELDRCEGVLTGCSVGIASTGTIVLRHTPVEGRRALTLVPDYHLCVAFEDQIVQTVPEAIRRLAEWGPALVTTISGPSATADIEMTRIRGVHGPRALDVILVA